MTETYRIRVEKIDSYDVGVKLDHRGAAVRMAERLQHNLIMNEDTNFGRVLVTTSSGAVVHVATGNVPDEEEREATTDEEFECPRDYMVRKR